MSTWFEKQAGQWCRLRRGGAPLTLATPATWQTSAVWHWQCVTLLQCEAHCGTPGHMTDKWISGRCRRPRPGMGRQQSVSNQLVSDGIKKVPIRWPKPKPKGESWKTLNKIPCVSVILKPNPPQISWRNKRQAFCELVIVTPMPVKSGQSTLIWRKDAIALNSNTGEYRWKRVFCKLEIVTVTVPVVTRGIQHLTGGKMRLLITRVTRLSNRHTSTWGNIFHHMLQEEERKMFQWHEPLASVSWASCMRESLEM